MNNTTTDSLFLTFWTDMTSTQFDQEVEELSKNRILEQKDTLDYKPAIIYKMNLNLEEATASLVLEPRFTNNLLNSIHLELIKNKEGKLDNYMADSILNLYKKKFGNPKTEENYAPSSSKGYSFTWELKNKIIKITKWYNGFSEYDYFLKKYKTVDYLFSFYIEYFDTKYLNNMKGQEDSIKQNLKMKADKTLKEL